MKFKSIFIFLILHFNFLFAQSISLDFGKSYPGSSFDGDWESDFTIGISPEFSLNESINIKPFFYYCSFDFVTSGIKEGDSDARNFEINKHHVISLGTMINISVIRTQYIIAYIQAGLGYMNANLEDITYIYGPNLLAFQDGYQFKGMMINLGSGMQLNYFERINPFIEFGYLIGYPDESSSVVNEFAYNRLSLGLKIAIFK